MTVGIVIPAYNGERFIARALQSVLSQTYSNWELVVVDDGSTDGTRGIVENYAQADERIRYLSQENSGGPARPLNTGVRFLKTEFVAFLEQDDEWLPDKLMRQEEVLSRRTDVVAVLSEAYVSYGENSKSRMRIAHRGTRDEWLLAVMGDRGFFYNLSTLMIRRTEALLDERLLVSGDYDLYITLAEKGFCVIHEPLSVYHASHNSLSKGTHALDKQIQDEIFLLKKHAALYARFPKAHARRLGFIGASLFCAGREREAWQYARRSLAVHWFQPLLWIKMILLGTCGVPCYLRVRNGYFKYCKKR